MRKPPRQARIGGLCTLQLRLRVLTVPVSRSPQPPTDERAGEAALREAASVREPLSCHPGYDVILDSVVARKILPAVVSRGLGTEARTECSREGDVGLPTQRSPIPRRQTTRAPFWKRAPLFRNGAGWRQQIPIKAGQGVWQAGSHHFAASAEWKASLCCRIPVAPTVRPPAAPGSGEGCQCEAETALWRGQRRPAPRLGR